LHAESHHPQEPLLRQALQWLTFSRDRQSATENLYLALYAVLESLIQLFVRQRPSVGLLLPKAQWRVVSAALKEAVRTSLPAGIAQETRDSIYSGLRSLNRASVGAVLRALCEQYSVDLSDLWPVAHDGNGITLTQIRNKLIHGYFIGPECERLLWIARVHLEWIVERLLLAMLGWDGRRHSRVGFMALKNFTPYHNWKQARQELTTAP
jgi:hypothetical protein